jgi:hypothetical protein
VSFVFIDLKFNTKIANKKHQGKLISINFLRKSPRNLWQQSSQESEVARASTEGTGVQQIVKYLDCLADRATIAVNTGETWLVPAAFWNS